MNIMFCPNPIKIIKKDSFRLGSACGLATDSLSICSLIGLFIHLLKLY